MFSEHTYAPTPRLTFLGFVLFLNLAVRWKIAFGGASGTACQVEDEDAMRIKFGGGERRRKKKKEEES